MKDQIQNEFTEKLRAVFEQLPPELWCCSALVLLEAAKDVCVEYYDKGWELMRARWDELIKTITSQYDEDD